MKLRVRIAVVIPAGPRDDIADTLASVVHYTDPARVILVIDDTSDPGCPARLRALSPDVVVLPAVGGVPAGALGGLWAKVSAGYRWLLDRYEPGLTLRLDADALMIGRGLEEAAEQAFTASPGVGLLGSYRAGPDGGTRDFTGVARQLRRETGLTGLRKPRLRAALRRRVALARRHGYLDGEHVLGSACLHSYPALAAMRRGGLLDQPWLAASRLGDDHILSLLTLAAGFRIGDFGGPADPLALRWQGLPAHPDDLLAARKLVTHSVRSWRELDEREIRARFARARAADNEGYG